MANFIDRRLNGKNKSSVNRQRFIRRYKKQIQQSVSDAATSREVTDVTSGESISIPTKDLGEPFFHQGQGGLKERVLPGNDQYQAGDQIARPKGGQGQGGGSGEASDSGEGADEFQFNISNDEYLDLLFEDLELPNLQKNKMFILKTICNAFGTFDFAFFVFFIFVHFVKGIPYQNAPKKF